jgi:hypothetical protein
LWDGKEHASLSGTGLAEFFPWASDCTALLMILRDALEKIQRFGLFMKAEGMPLPEPPVNFANELPFILLTLYPC